MQAFSCATAYLILKYLQLDGPSLPSRLFFATILSSLLIWFANNLIYSYSQRRKKDKHQQTLSEIKQYLNIHDSVNGYFKYYIESKLYLIEHNPALYYFVVWCEKEKKLNPFDIIPEQCFFDYAAKGYPRSYSIKSEKFRLLYGK